MASNKAYLDFILEQPNHAFALGGYVIFLSKTNHKFGTVDEIMTSDNLSDLYEVNIKVIEDEGAGKIAVSI